MSLALLFAFCPSAGIAAANAMEIARAFASTFTVSRMNKS
jgi:hypothetical protein